MCENIFNYNTKTTSYVFFDDVSSVHHCLDMCKTHDLCENAVYLTKDYHKLNFRCYLKWGNVEAAEPHIGLQTAMKDCSKIPKLPEGTENYKGKPIS